MPEKIIAAGGIVTNENDELLLFFRRISWDLPKGKLDESEEVETCAVREVEEETGLRNITLGKLIGTTTHYYAERGKDIEKLTYWFKMEVSGNQELVPQVEEDITNIRWVSKKELQQYLDNTYPNIVSIVETYLAT